MDHIEDYANRPRRYFNIDGLREVSIGLIVLAFPLCGRLANIMPKDSVWQLVGLLPIVVWIPILRGAEVIRKRITFRRTGFVAQRQDAAYYLQILVVLALSFLVFYAPFKLPPLRHLNPFAVMGVYGMILAAGYAFEFARDVRWKRIVVLVLVCGSLAIPVFSRDFWHGVGRMFTFVGATWVISGGITFYLYLRHTQPAARAAE